MVGSVVGRDMISFPFSVEIVLRGCTTSLPEHEGAGNPQKALQ